jgi:hypothetical protein
VQHGSPDPPQSSHSVDVPTGTQSVPDSVHALPAQHGEYRKPQKSHIPSEPHTSLSDGVPHESPVATHVLVVDRKSQQPIWQASPGQQGWPGRPHALHAVAMHTAPPEQESPSKTHVCVPGSQQPLSHGAAPAQQAAP